MGIRSRAIVPSQAVIAEIQSYAIDLANYVGTPFDLAVGQIWTESKFDPKSYRYNDDNKNDRSYGLMHLALPTALQVAMNFGYNRIATTDLYDPIFNIWLGLQYMLDQFTKYGTWQDALAAYNLGHVAKNADGTYVNQAYVDNVTSYAQQFTA